MGCVFGLATTPSGPIRWYNVPYQILAESIHVDGSRQFAARWSPAVWIITMTVLGVIVGVEVRWLGWHMRRPVTT